MSDRDRHDYAQADRERDRAGYDRGRHDDRFREAAGDRGGDFEHRSWSGGDDREHRGRSADTPYGRPETGVQNRSEGGYVGGGYGDQGGFGSQHGQGGYASPAQGSRYGQTSSEWGRSGYGSHGGDHGGRSYGGGQATGFGATSYDPDRDDYGRRWSGERDYGARGQAGGAAWGGRESYGEGGYGAARPDRGGGTYGQGYGDRSAQRSLDRTDQGYGGGQGAYGQGAYGAGAFGSDVRTQTGASGQSFGQDDHDHEPHYRFWRDQQLQSHDQDYGRWRDQQARRYDDEYRSYRDQRHDSFSRDFGAWRGSNASTPGQTSHPGQTSGVKAGHDSATTGGSTGGAALASDEHLRNVTDGGSGHADHKTDKADAKTDDKAAHKAS